MHSYFSRPRTSDWERARRMHQNFTFCFYFLCPTSFPNRYFSVPHLRFLLFNLLRTTPLPLTLLSGNENACYPAMIWLSDIFAITLYQPYMWWQKPATAVEHFCYPALPTLRSALKIFKHLSASISLPAGVFSLGSMNPQRFHERISWV